MGDPAVDGHCLGLRDHRVPNQLDQQARQGNGNDAVELLPRFAFLLFDLGLDGLPRQNQPGFYGARGAVHGLRDLLHRHFLVVVQQDRLPLHIGQLADDLPQALRQIAALGVLLRKHQVGFQLQHLAVLTLFFHGEGRPGLPNQGIALVEGDMLQPGVEGCGILQGAETLPGLDEGTLQHVFRIGVVFHGSPRQRIDLIIITLVQFLKAFRVAVSRGEDQRLIRHGNRHRTSSLQSEPAAAEAAEARALRKLSAAGRANQVTCRERLFRTPP